MRNSRIEIVKTLRKTMITSVSNGKKKILTQKHKKAESKIIMLWPREPEGI